MKESGQKKNPLFAIELGSYDLAQRGLLKENLEILSALKAAQVRYLNRIIKLHGEEVKFSDYLRACGSWIFLRHYPESGERAFAGGFTCKSPHCIPCAFRRAYIGAKTCFGMVKQHLARHPQHEAKFGIHSLLCAEGIDRQYKAIKQQYRQILRRRRNQRQHHGGIGGFHFEGTCEDCGGWLLEIREIVLLDRDYADPPEEPVTDDLLFEMLLEVYLCGLIGSTAHLTREQRFLAVQTVEHPPLIVPSGVLSGIEYPNDSSDPVEPHLADQPFQEEQYRWDFGQQLYVLEKVNTGDAIQLPFEGYKRSHRTGGRGARARRAARLKVGNSACEVAL